VTYNLKELTGIQTGLIILKGFITPSSAVSEYLITGCKQISSYPNTRPLRNSATHIRTQAKCY
ncbi:hypothetical protein ABK046_46225, partial [Streptomyces caeruleatus]